MPAIMNRIGCNLERLMVVVAVVDRFLDLGAGPVQKPDRITLSFPPSKSRMRKWHEPSKCQTADLLMMIDFRGETLLQPEMVCDRFTGVQTPKFSPICMKMLEKSKLDRVMASIILVDTCGKITIAGPKEASATKARIQDRTLSPGKEVERERRKGMWRWGRRKKRAQRQAVEKVRETDTRVPPPANI